MPYTIQTNILLIEEDPVYSRHIHKALANHKDSSFKIEWVRNLTDALICLNSASKSQMEVILLAPPSPEKILADDFLAIDLLLHAAPNVLILLLCRDCSEDFIHRAMVRGVHDCIGKDHIDSYWLPRALRSLAERKMNRLVVQAIETELCNEKRRAQATFNALEDAVLVADVMGRVNYLNSTAEAMTGWTTEEAFAKPLEEVFSIVESSTRQVSENPILRAIAENRRIALAPNTLLICNRGSEYNIEGFSTPVRNGETCVLGGIIVFRDISESRLVASKMAYLAQHDTLTGLPNRLLLTERLSQAMTMAYRSHKQVALLFLDLDRFKHINDSLGHAVGDELLKSVAERLVSCVRASDTVCRQGGDEFVILLTEIERPEDASFTAEKLLASFSLPHMIDIHELHITLSIGISIYPADGTTAELLMQNADAAMYHAKAIGRNNVQFFKAEMNASAVQRSFIEAGLRRAIKQKEFVLHYQPKVDILSDRIMGVEAFLRWQHPTLGLLYPADFLTVAEECGLMIPIGAWVLQQACQQSRSWLNTGLQIVPVAINISASELKNKNFIAGVNQVLKDTGLPPYYIEMEFTETILMRDAEFSVKVLESLKAIGVQLAIDDFGAGYSSLSYLKRFPVDTLKIDRSFIDGFSADAENATIISAVIGMGRNLKQRVLAEGVETADQYAFIRTQRCGEAQGLYFSKPLPAEEFVGLLKGNNSLPGLSVRKRTDDTLVKD